MVHSFLYRILVLCNGYMLMWGYPCVQSPLDRRWLASGLFGTSRLSMTTAGQTEFTSVGPLKVHQRAGCHIREGVRATQTERNYLVVSILIFELLCFNLNLGTVQGSLRGVFTCKRVCYDFRRLATCLY